MAGNWGPANAAKPKLTQEEFDEAVSTNIEDFGMEPEEAVKSAIDEFKIQGYDLSGVVTSKSAKEIEKDPLWVATRTLEGASSSSSSSSNRDTIASTLSEIQQLLAEGGVEGLAERFIVAQKAGCLKAVMAVCQWAFSSGPPQQDLLVQALCVATSLMGQLEMRDSFDDLQGAELLAQVLSSPDASSRVLGAAATLAEQSGFKEEQNKERLVDSGVTSRCLELLQQPELHPEVVVPCCGVVRSVVTADDERPPTSKAFTHARMLASQHGAVKVLLGVLRRFGEKHAQVAISALQAIKQVAANDEICKEFADEGGLTTCIDILRSSQGSQPVAKAVLGALRKLAHSDPTKKALAEAGGVELVMTVMGRHSSSPEVVELGLALLANMTLRMPDIVEVAAAAGLVDVLIEAMTEHASSPQISRQGCIVLRNCVVRNTHLRPTFLAKGAEALLRAAKKAHARDCKDVGSAALRDLGLDNYND